MIKMRVGVSVTVLHRLGIGYYYGMDGKLASKKTARQLMEQVLETFLDDMAQLAQDNMEDEDAEEPDTEGDASDSPEEHQ